MNRNCAASNSCWQAGFFTKLLLGFGKEETPAIVTAESIEQALHAINGQLDDGFKLWYVVEQVSLCMHLNDRCFVGWTPKLLSSL